MSRIDEKSRSTGELVHSIGNPKTLYRRLESRRRGVVTILFALLASGLSFGYVTWLVGNAVVGTLTAVIILALTVEFMRLAFVTSLSWTAVMAKIPIPVCLRDNMNIALAVTFVPSSEDPEMLEELLLAAKDIKHPTHGSFSIFVLDEGDGEVVQPIVDRLNISPAGHRVFRVSRHGQEPYQTTKGPFCKKTKYGNINAALDHIAKNAPQYGGPFDVVMGLDPDHIPMEGFAERMLGYLNDPDVAYVVGPQSYANSQHNVVAKLAESQQFVFHTLSQVGANACQGPMMVGTSYAIRWNVLDQIGGIQPSITEDMATSFAILPRRNPATRRTWKAVYTPDLLAHGEGPGTWGDFFKQQDRWSRGSIEYAITGKLAWGMMKMWRKPARIIHYTLLMSFYPIMGAIWLLAAVNLLLVALLGPSSVAILPEHWVVLYGWAAFSQVAFYTWMRRYNTSPYETSYSWGIYGMFMSVISSPIYAAALVKAILRRPAGFNVTPKGSKAKGDSWFTFRLSLAWTVFYILATSLAAFNGNLVWAAMSWPILAICLSLAPVVIWKVTALTSKATIAVPAMVTEDTVPIRIAA